MKGLYAIYRKEMSHYFVSPIAYVIVGLFLLLAAIFFNFYLTAAIEQSQALMMQSMRFGAPQDFDATSAVLRAFFGIMSTLILFLTPIITMGVYAEERKRGTMELLMTSPVTDLQIVLGKFLAALSLLAIMLIPTASYLIFMFLRSEPAAPWRMLLTGYAGILLLGGSLMALGTFISSLTESQIIAAVFSFAAMLILWIFDIGSRAPGKLGDLFQYLSVIRHYEDFPRGVVDTSSLIYYASLIALFVFLTVRSLDSMRWRSA
jgi:ABC-2 type transport system permease protein